jgi:hypothetical protein
MLQGSSESCDGSRKYKNGMGRGQPFVDRKKDPDSEREERKI